MPTIVKVYGDIVEITEYEKEKSQKVRLSSSYERGDVFKQRRIDNIRRTRQVCMRRLSCAIETFGSPLLLTLTHKGSATDAWSSSQSLKTFFKRLRIEYSLSACLFVPEVSPRGRIHWHGLLFGVSQSCGDLYKGRRIIYYGSERKTRQLHSFWSIGFVDVRQTNGNSRLAGYLSKYINKHDNTGFSVLLNGLRLIRATINFPKELVIKDSMLCDRVSEKYRVVEPIHSWSTYTHFQGNLTKKKYRRIL